MQPNTCVRCGVAFPFREGKGRQPARCPDCRTQAVEKPPREAPCIDCGTTVRPAGKTGSVPQRCDKCKAAFHKENRRRPGRTAYPCADCGVDIQPSRTIGATQKRCDECRAQHIRLKAAERRQRWKQENPEKLREQAKRHYDKRMEDRDTYLQYRRDGILRRTYGLTREDYDALEASQDHRCAICRGTHVGTGTRFHVDHNHTTGAIRGLLCGNCNTAIGLLGDDLQRVEAAAAYLRLHGET